MSANPHDRIEEMMAARALGGLSAADEAELELLREEHGRDCVECRRLESAFGEVAGRLAFAVDPAPVRAGMADQILARADREEARQDGRALRTPTWWSRRLVAAAAAVLLLVAGGVGGYLVRQPGPQPAGSQALASFLSGPTTRVAHFSGSGHGTLSLAFRPGRPTGFLFGSGLAPAPSGKVYELWTFRGGGAPVPSGTFTASGRVVVLRVLADLSGARMMAVTVEHAPGAEQPTSKPIFTAPVIV
jgi:anti-sigma-K factor RskA